MVVVVDVDLDLCAIHWSQLKAPPFVVSSKIRTFHDKSDDVLLIICINGVNTWENQTRLVSPERKTN